MVMGVKINNEIKSEFSDLIPSEFGSTSHPFILRSHSVSKISLHVMVLLKLKNQERQPLMF